MKFFFGIVLFALVALASSAEIPKEINPEKAVPASEAEPATSGRNKRGFVLSAYTAPVAAAALPVAAAPIAAPVAYSYSAGLPYAYSAYSAYAPYYSGVPAVYL